MPHQDAPTAIDSAQRADLATSALGMAIDSRHPAAGGIIHGDHGSQGGFNQWTQHRLAVPADATPLSAGRHP